MVVAGHDKGEAIVSAPAFAHVLRSYMALSAASITCSGTASAASGTTPALAPTESSVSP